MAMRIDKHYRVGSIRSANWVNEAKSLGLPPEDVVDRVRRLAAAVPDALSDERRLLDVTGPSAAFADRFLDRVATHVTWCADRLA
jgi:hypothetical protein